MKSIIFTSLVFFIMLVLAGCEQNSQAPAKQFESVWIETSERSDTITFLGEGLLTLGRGREFNGEHFLPKRGAGIYEYEIKDDSVALYNTYSSCYCFTDYFFSIENDTLKIGDFYRKDTTKQNVLVFVKLK